VVTKIATAKLPGESLCRLIRLAGKRGQDERRDSFSVPPYQPGEMTSSTDQVAVVEAVTNLSNRASGIANEVWR